jgi:hypothetical protein
MKSKYFELTAGMLAELLHLPEGSEVFAMEWMPDKRSVRIYVTHPSFPDLEDGWYTEATRLSLVHVDGHVEGSYG